MYEGLTPGFIVKYEADPCLLKVAIATPSTEFCAGTSTVLTANATEVSGTPTYQWKRDGANVGDGKNTLTATEGGSYTVEVTDAAGCKATAQAVTLTKSDPKVSIKADRTEYCADGSATLTAEPTGGIGTYTYLWKKDGTTTGSISNTLSGAKAGTYTVEATDQKGCKSPVAEQKITENTKPSANAGGNVTKYASDKHTVPGTTATGGTAPYQYNWTTNPGVEGNNSAASNPTFGPFDQSTELTLKVTDAKGCEATSKATVTYSACPLNVTLSPGNTDFCAGGTVPTLTATVTNGSGTLKYEWKRDGTKVGEAATLTAGESGKYTVTVTDDRCSAPSGEVTIRKSDPKVSVSAEKSEFCAGGTTTLSASASGGLGTYSYQWKKAGANTGGNSNQLTGATGGTYTVEVTDNTGCKVTSAPQSLTENALPTPALTGAATFCEGASTPLTATSATGTTPFTFQWKLENATIGGNNAVHAATAPGTYSVVITDAKGCVGPPATRSVVQNPRPKVEITGVKEYCRGASTVLSSQMTSGTPSSYQWYRNGQPIASKGTSGSYEAASPGTYTVTVSDASGCQGTSPEVIITEKQTDIVAQIIPVGSTSVQAPATVTLNATAGVGYAYQWLLETAPGVLTPIPGATGVTYTAAKSGNYYYVASKDGCSIPAAGVKITIEPITSVGQETVFQINLFPNPATEQVRLEVTTPQAEVLHVRLLNPQGQESAQWTQTTRSNQHVLELDLHRIPVGLYFLHIQASTQRQTRKLVRVR